MLPGVRMMTWQAMTADQLSDLVGSIYECALDPAGWNGTLKQICEAVGGDAAALAIQHLVRMQSIFEVEYNTDPVYQQRFREDYVTLSPFFVAGHFLKLGDVASIADVMDHDEFLESRFYREWAGPQGWPDLILGAVSKSTDRLGYLGICMPAPARPEQKADFARLVPHIVRAVRISNVLEYRAAESGVLAAVVAGLSAGVILVDASLRVHSVNPAAEAMMARTSAVSIERGMLRLSDGNAALRSAILAGIGAGTAAAKAPAFVLSSPDGEVGLVLDVLPLPPSRGGGAQEPAAALFMTAPTLPLRLPTELLIAHFRITPSELRVLLGLLEGRSPNDIAVLHGLSMPTIRTHLRSLYEKTGTRGQTDLVALLTRMASPAHDTSGHEMTTAAHPGG